MRAEIQWITKEDGGRKNPPAGLGSPPYATVVRFTDTDEPWPPGIAWSLVIEKRESQSSEYHWIADVKYTIENAPHDSLRPGRPFELYEGNKCAGTIMGD